jgi:hypothetical protein
MKHTVARLSILDLPVKIRELICEYVRGIHDCIYLVDVKVLRPEDPHTLAEYWEADYNRFCTNQRKLNCKELGGLQDAISSRP